MYYVYSILDDPTFANEEDLEDYESLGNMLATHVNGWRVVSSDTPLLQITRKNESLRVARRSQDQPGVHSVEDSRLPMAIKFDYGRQFNDELNKRVF